MLKKFLMFAMVITLFNFSTGAAIRVSAQSESTSAQKVRERVAKLGVGEKARVTVRLRDKTKLKGYISEAGATDFRVTDANTGSPTTIAYTDVERIEGRGLSTKAKVAIGVAIGVGALAAFAAIITRGGTRRVLD